MDLLVSKDKEVKKDFEDYEVIKDFRFEARRVFEVKLVSPGLMASMD
jgi:hypothetical protein